MNTASADAQVGEVILETKLPGLKLAARGKVRDIYDLGERLLIVATDRISAFDCILPTGIPDKGRVLTALSRFWFGALADVTANHLADEVSEVPASKLSQWRELCGRSMLVRKAEPFPVECVARGYLSGSAWKEYRGNAAAGRLENGQIPCAGLLLPPGLVESARLPTPVFTPSTKAASGHDEPLTFTETSALLGGETAEQLRALTLQLYVQASEYALERGIIIADTKFEFGRLGDEIILIDEVLTPDSSRFWDLATYEPGGPQPSFDKQFVRDYLETLDWDKQPPAPALPDEIAHQTAEKYRGAYRRLTGAELSH